MKRFILFFGILVYLLQCNFSAYSQIENKVKKVVIDAGHGGMDPGALGRNSKEKDIVLSVALKTGKLIQDSIKDVEVIYTRKTDVFIELYKRAQIANESGADVFISIHCNSNKSSKPFGAETYVMGLHKTTENLEVAKTENASIFFEDDYKSQYEGFDPNSDEDYIILSMFQSANIDQSIDLSSKVEKELCNRYGRKDRGVKQAGFWVLYKTTMPGILVELGFLSNVTEEKYLMSDKGQDEMAYAIFKAFSEYKHEFEEANNNLVPLAVKEPDPTPDIFYRVQFASYKKEKSLDFRKFRGLKNIKMYKHDGQFKYTTGNENSIEAARIIKKRMVEEGYEDVFIVAFMNGKRISIDDAKSLTGYKTPNP